MEESSIEEVVSVSDLVSWNFTLTPTTSASAALLSWYANLPSQRLDLVGELGDSRGRFVIQGDSLLTHVINMHVPRIGEDQLFLSAIYFFEKYLDIFKHAKKSIKSISIIFFDSLSFQFVNESELALRQLVIAHLLKTFGTEIVLQFPDWTCLEFNSFVTGTDIAVFVLADDVNTQDEGSDEGAALVGSMYLALALHLLTVFRQRIAFFDRLEQRGNRIVAFSVGQERRHEGVHAKVVSSLAPILQQMRDDNEQGESTEGDCLVNAIRLTVADLETDSAAIPLVVLKCILLASALSKTLSLEDRCLSTISPSDWSIFDASEGLFALVWNQVAGHAAELLKSECEFSIDFFDGRLFRTLVYSFWEQGYFAGKTFADKKAWMDEAVRNWSLICPGNELFDLCLPEIDAPSASLAPVVAPAVASAPPALNWPLLGGPDRSSAGTNAAGYIPETQLVTRRFADRKKKDHDDQKAKWKHLSIEKLAGRMRNWELRGAQKELRAMHQYAKSLVGADSLHHAIAVVQDQGGRKRRTKEEEKVEEAGPKVGKKAAEIIARNVAASQKTQAGKDTEQIKPLLDRVELISESRDFHSLETHLFDLCAGFSRILDSFDGFKGITCSVKLEASQIKVISAVLKATKSAMKKLVASAVSHMSSDEAKLGLRNAAAKILRMCTSFVQEYRSAIEGKEIVRVQELLLCLGFSQASKSLFSMWRSALKDSKKADEFLIKSSKVTLLADVPAGDEYLFELLHLSAELDRPSGTLADKRVMFKPDYWQKELLDIVDKNESALVCAPTASGKTFICYYAMEKVLRTSNDKVAVYVAPSKALMNQVDAEIYARFRSKTYPASTDHFQLSGDLEKDYQHNPFNCQVLVTVPAMLEQLLLDPTMQDWVARIEYVIFDEVHVMGESADESAIWEHALQLIPCPFLAMSATVGNPGKFHGWLNRVAELKRGPKVHLIEYKERYNDLQKFAFAPEEKALLSIHPFTVLSYSDVLSGVIPPDLTMTPAETALLVAVMKTCVMDHAADPADAKDRLKAISPKRVFEKQIPVEGMITKRQFREYESLVLGEFIKLNESGLVNEKVFKAIQDALTQSPVVGNAKSVNELWALVRGEKKETCTTVNIAKALNVTETKCYLDPVWLCQFLNQLDAYAFLPGIIFNLDRSEIMKMVERLGEHLRAGQYEKYYGSEERAYATRAINKKRMDAFEANVARRRLMERKNKKDEDFDEAEISEGIPLPVMVEDEFDAAYSFAGVKALSDPECHELIDKLSEGKRIKPWIIEALRRGIGMHHEGCSTRLKKAVEVLFRRGFLRGVIATGTLSLGINMPCKSTIFVGTHVKLNALNYRQMAGRAGRRGFDLLGHVIFVDSTQKNVRRLLTSELTQLGGDFALTPSHVLRSQIMMDAMAGNPLAAKVKLHLQAMLKGGFLPYNVGGNSELVLRTTAQFLVDEALLTPEGHVTRLGSLVAFLFKREPENFVIAKILLSRDLLAQVEEWIVSEQTDQPMTMATFKLMQVLSSFCFTRPQLRGAKRREILPRKRNMPTPTCPLLPASDISSVATEFNARSVASVVARVLPESVSVTQLPVSRFTVTPSSPATVGEPLASMLAAQKIPSQLRSVFSALAGKGDQFDSALELVMSANQRPELMLDSASVLAVATEGLSSYACDFLLHGKLSLLQNDCLIGVSESWKEIDEWRFFLESLNIALEFMFELDNTHEYANLQRVVKALTVELTAKLHAEGA